MLNKTVKKNNHFTFIISILCMYILLKQFTSFRIYSGGRSGMIYAIIQTPPGSTLERTNQIARELLRESEDIDGVQSVSSLAGYEILQKVQVPTQEPVLSTLKVGKNVKNLLRKL
jgi:multidrug efflux pump subunit AcrB